MSRKKKKDWLWVKVSLLIVLIISTSVSFVTTVIRAKGGKDTYWENGLVVSINGISSSISSLLILGLIAVVLIKKANKRGFDIWDFLLIFFSILLMSTYIVTTIMRTKHGADSYWSNPWLIILNHISFDIGTSMIGGYLIGILANKFKNR